LHAVEPLARLAIAIQDARLTAGMTQVDLSLATGVHIRTIIRIEQCHRLPEDRTVHKLGVVLITDPAPWMALLREAKRLIRKAGGLDAFDEATTGVV